MMFPPLSSGGFAGVFFDTIVLEITVFVKKKTRGRRDAAHMREVRKKSLSLHL